MIITPLAPRDPYIEVAPASFNTSKLSISFGFKVDNGFAPCKASMLNGTPSITNRGWFNPPPTDDNGEVSPLILIRTGAPGRPVF